MKKKKKKAKVPKAPPPPKPPDPIFCATWKDARIAELENGVPAAKLAKLVPDDIGKLYAEAYPYAPDKEHETRFLFIRPKFQLFMNALMQYDIALSALRVRMKLPPVPEGAPLYRGEPPSPKSAPAPQSAPVGAV